MVHLVRHGEVDNPDHLVYASLPGFSLSATGRRQAAAVAEHLEGAPVSAVWSSPLQRALETATPLAVRLQVPVLVDPELSEWRLSDRWAGRGWEGLSAEFPTELENYLSAPDDLGFSPESLPELAARMDSAIRRIAATGGGEVVIVSHQDPVQAARLNLTGVALRRLHNDKPEHGTVITLRPGTGAVWDEVSVWTPRDA